MARIPAMTPTNSIVRSAHDAGGRIMEHKNTTVGGDGAITRRLKVPPECPPRGGLALF
jgi:hypothetical protein